MLHFINGSNLIAYLCLLLEIPANMCIAIICYPVYDLKNFEIIQSFFIKLFFCMPKKSGQKCKLYQARSELLSRNKNYFYHFQRAFIEVNINNFLEIESSTLIEP